MGSEEEIAYHLSQLKTGIEDLNDLLEQGFNAIIEQLSGIRNEIANQT